MPSFSFVREMKQQIAVLNTGENVTAIQDQELKCTWTTMVVPGTQVLYSFGPDLLPLSYSDCFPLPPENHLLRALQWTEEIMKPVGLKGEPSAPLCKFSLKYGILSAPLHLMETILWNGRRRNDLPADLNILAKDQTFWKAAPGYCVVTFL